MTKNDVVNIFNLKSDEIILQNGAHTTVDKFLDIAGFSECEPTKQAMLDFDNGTKGYKELIENGNFELTQ